MRSFVGKHPIAIFVGIGFVGAVLAYVWAGYVGNPGFPGTEPWSIFIREPWTLFVLFVALIIAAQLYTARLPVLRSILGGAGPQVRMVLVTLLLAGGVAIYQLLKLPINPPAILRDIVNALDNLGALFAAHHHLGIVLLWLIFIALFVGGVIWARRHPDVVVVQQGNEPIPFERLVGDLVVGMVYSWVVLTPLFLPSTLQALPSAIKASSACDSTLALWCDPRHIPVLIQFSVLDGILLPLICALGVVFIVTYFATVKALATHRPAQIFIAVWWATLKGIIVRRINLANLVVRLRFLWPVCALVAVAAAAVCAHFNQEILSALRSASAGKLSGPFYLDQQWSNYVLRFWAIVSVAVMLVATVLSVALRITPQRAVLADWPRTVRRVFRLAWGRTITLGQFIVVLYCVFSFIFWLINLLVNVIAQPASANTPQGLAFIQPDPVAVVALVLTLFIGWRYLSRRSKPHHNGIDQRPARAA